MMEGFCVVMVVLTFVAAVVLPLVIYVRLRKQMQADAAQMLTRLDENLGASVKMLEVRNYYGHMSGEYKKMLDEAYKEGNRFRQDHIRKLIERLDQLKARTFDKTVRILEQQQQEPHGGHRRHRGGRRHGGGFRPRNEGQGNQGGQSPQGGQPKPPQGGNPPKPPSPPPAPPKPPQP